MIYFGYSGEAPWHTPAGSIWFFAGILFWMFTTMALRFFGEKKALKDWMLWAIVFTGILSVGIPSAALSGYYSWFAGVRAQIGTCRADLEKLRKEFKR